MGGQRQTNVLTPLLITVAVIIVVLIVWLLVRRFGG